MIKTVDKNGDGKINYSEFRVSKKPCWLTSSHHLSFIFSLQVMMGAPPLLIPATTLSKFARSATALTNLTNAALFSGHTAQPSTPPPETREKYWEAFSESRMGFLPIMQWLLFTFVLVLINYPKYINLFIRHIMEIDRREILEYFFFIQTETVMIF